MHFVEDISPPPSPTLKNLGDADLASVGAELAVLGALLLSGGVGGAELALSLLLLILHNKYVSHSGNPVILI